MRVDPLNRRWSVFLDPDYSRYVLRRPNGHSFETARGPTGRLRTFLVKVRAQKAADILNRQGMGDAESSDATRILRQMSFTPLS